MDFCIYDDILDTIRTTDKKLLHFKLSESAQTLHVDKTSFARPGHILKIKHSRNHVALYDLTIYVCIL